MSFSGANYTRVPEPATSSFVYEEHDSVRDNLHDRDEVLQPVRRKPPGVALGGIRGVRQDSRFYYPLLPVNIAVQDNDAQLIDPAGPRKTVQILMCYTPVEAAAVRDLAILWREFHTGGTGHPSTMHASSALNFPFDKWVAQEALMQQLRDAAGLKALRRLADALLFSYGGEKAGQLKMAAVLAALGWAGRPLTVDGWKAYKQQQEQAQQQVQGAQRGELPALHRGQPKSCQSVGVILKSGASKERPYEAFLSLRVLPSGQVGHDGKWRHSPLVLMATEDEAAVLRDVAVMWRERQYGAKGSLAKQDWNFAPAGYQADEQLMAALEAAGPMVKDLRELARRLHHSGTLVALADRFRQARKQRRQQWQQEQEQRRVEQEAAERHAGDGEPAGGAAGGPAKRQRLLAEEPAAAVTPQQEVRAALMPIQQRRGPMRGKGAKLHLGGGPAAAAAGIKENVPC